VRAHGLDGARLREVLRDVLAGGDAQRAVMAELTGHRDVGAERIGAPATDRV